MTSWGGTLLPRREVPRPALRDAPRREDTQYKTRAGPSWVTDPSTLRRVRDALVQLAGGSGAAVVDGCPAGLHVQLARRCGYVPGLARRAGSR